MDSEEIKTVLSEERTVQPFSIDVYPHSCVGSHSSVGQRKWISFRYQFAMLAFFGFVNLYALRVNLSVAIVAMVRHSQTTEEVTPLHGTCPHNNGTGSSKNPDGEFLWDTQTQGVILSSFFYGYIVTQLPGAWIANRFGAKHPFGLSVFIAGLLALFIPVAAKWHYGALIAVRILQGVSEGVCFPSAHTLLGKWCPISERSHIVSIAYSGMHIGTVGTLLLSGLLADYLGWESIFYFFGTCAILWYIIWALFGHESPESHPQISAFEKEYITSSIGRAANHDHNSGYIPWKKMLVSMPVWAIAVGHFGNNWGFYTLLTQLPTYLNNVLHFSLKENGFNSALPYFAMAIVMPISGFFADLLRRRRYLSTTNVRRVFHFLGVALPAVCLVAVSYTGCDVVMAMLLLTLAVGSAGLASAGGFQTNHIDVSPTFGGILMGLSNTLATIPGIVGPYVVGIITTNQTTSQWQTVFFISAGIYLITGIFYVIFCSGEPESWEKKTSDNLEEDT